MFTFNSIYIGPETEVLVVGQRALALLSRTTAFINTTIVAAPGTLGGFQGKADRQQTSCCVFSVSTALFLLS